MREPGIGWEDTRGLECQADNLDCTLDEEPANAFKLWKDMTGVVFLND